MATLLRKCRLPPVQFHAVVGGFEVDFLVIDTKVILKCDGWGSHGLQRNQFEFDRIRNATLTAAGYIIVHFTWARLAKEPDAVARDFATTWRAGRRRSSPADARRRRLLGAVRCGPRNELHPKNALWRVSCCGCCSR